MDKESYLKAFLEEVGLPPSECVVFEKPFFGGYISWVEPRNGNEVMEGWERLADQSKTLAALRVALKQTKYALELEVYGRNPTPETREAINAANKLLYGE